MIAGPGQDNSGEQYTMGYFLALDAGGTKTECWLGDEERVLGRASAETVKLMSVGAQEATHRLRGLVESVAATAGVSPGSIQRTCMGLAGISSEGVRVWAEVTLRELVSGELIITGDEEIALHAAFGEGPGVLVIAGTGSHVVGRCGSGARMNAGGWGPMLGDEGSGHWIGLEAIRSALRARDRGVPGCLLRDINSFWGVENVGGLIAKANQRPRPDFSELAAVVANCSDQGDVLATSVLERAGQELAAQVSIVFSKMAAGGCPAADLRRVAFTGSVLGKVPRVLAEMRTALQRLYPGIEVDSEPVLAVAGALARARKG